jgi:hypothetical protein
MATYATLAQLKAYLFGPGVVDTTNDTELNDALETASRGIDHFCSRKFNPDTNATARVFRPRSSCLAVVDDFYETAALIVKVDPAGNGTYSTTLTLNTDFILEPSNGVVDGETGWPYYRIVAVNSAFLDARVPSLQVTAKWGWAATPGPVKQACIYLAEETFKMKGSPFGVANMDQFGPIRMRDNPKVMSMLAPYRLYPILVA